MNKSFSALLILLLSSNLCFGEVTDQKYISSDSVIQTYHSYIESVPEISVQTSVGILPHLPASIKVNYKNGFQGPNVLVIWPAPENAARANKPGKYIINGKISGSKLIPRAIITVVENSNSTSPTETLEGFNLQDIELEPDLHSHSTEFTNNRDKFTLQLLLSNPDDFLYMFRNAFGQPQAPGAKALGVWDSQEIKLRGHTTGHYLSALAQAYAGSVCEDKSDSIHLQFEKKIAYMVNELYKLSKLSGSARYKGDIYTDNPLLVPPAGKNFSSDLSEKASRTDYWNWGVGYISAYPPDQFIMLENGAKYGSDSTKVWAPYYTLHKILSGLLDVYEYTGNQKSLEIVEGMAVWVHTRLSQIPDSTLTHMWNRYIAGEFGGMNETMARLYRITGDEKYLDTAHFFDNTRLFFADTQHTGGLSKNVDLFRGLHANQHIPQMLGALEIYRNSQQSEYFQIASNFWEMVRYNYMYSIGGVAGASHPDNPECFIAEPGSLFENGFSKGGQNETCATYNLLKLSRNLFLFDQKPEYMDYYERALYNHILASVAEDSPANTYHVPLRPGSIKDFSNPEMTGFTCCNGTAMESNTKFQENIYFRSKDNNTLFVNLFIPSTLKWTKKGVEIKQTTSFPEEDYTLLMIDRDVDFDMMIRIPSWVGKGAYIRINGTKAKLNLVPGSYVNIGQSWKKGDLIEIKLPFTFRLEPLMDQANIASLFYGPVLLAAQESGNLDEWRKITLNAWDLGQTINRSKQVPLEFDIDGIQFKPFYKSYRHHSVYFNVNLVWEK